MLIISREEHHDVFDPLSPVGQEGDSAYRWMRRSELAMQLCPDMKRKDAGIAVARIIQQNPRLKSMMYEAGYQPGKVGYTPKQVRILCEYFITCEL